MTPVELMAGAKVSDPISTVIKRNFNRIVIRYSFHGYWIDIENKQDY